MLIVIINTIHVQYQGETDKTIIKTNYRCYYYFIYKTNNTGPHIAPW